MLSTVIKRYVTFLKRSATTLENDITQPYHKVIDITLKLLSLILAFWGIYIFITATNCYFSPQGPTAPSYCATLFQRFHTVHGDPSWFQFILMHWLQGVGYLLIAIFASQVLVVRHLNETLPDHIYLRCFSNDGEKKRRLPLRHSTHVSQ